MSFAQPVALIAVAALPLLWAFFAIAERRRRRSLGAFVGDPAEAAARAARHRQGRLPAKLAASAFLCLAIVALMQPQWGRRAEDAPRAGRDIVVLLDASLSMLAEDAAPNRFEAARAAVRGLAQAVRADGGHRLALIAFAGRASLQSPLTLDYDLFLDRLAATEVGAVAYEGSALGSALGLALDRLGLAPGHADLVLVSDGEDHAGLARDAARAAAAAGVDLYALAIGRPGEGALIPVTVEGKRAVVEFDGFPVRSRVGDELLTEMARLTGGRYLGAGADPAALAGLYRAELRAKPARVHAQTAPEVPAHRFQWFALAAFLALAAERALAGRRRQPA